MAAIITRGRIEIRFHERSMHARVREIVRILLAHPELGALTAWCARWRVTYQGRDLAV